jgi:hypothetical protein
MKKTIDRLLGSVVQHNHKEVIDNRSDIQTLSANDTENVKISVNQSIDSEKQFNENQAFVKNVQLESPVFSMNNSNGVIYKHNVQYNETVPFIHDFNYGDNGTVTTDGANLFVGGEAGNFTTGVSATVSYNSSYNVAFGGNAMHNIENGYVNVALGGYSMYAFKNGRNNLGCGAVTLYQLESGEGNTAVGGYAAYSLTGGNNNTAVGDRSMPQLETGDHNIAIGTRSMYASKNVSKNLCIGDDSGFYCETSGNLFIGHGAGHTAISTNDTFVLNNSYVLYSQPVDEAEHALMWGLFNNDPSQQYLRFNASTAISGELRPLGGIKYNRKTVTSDYTLTINDYLISVKPTADTNVTLPTTPEDGKAYEIYAVNLDYTITIKGNINGITDYLITSAKDNIKLIYNADESTWEIR